MGLTILKCLSALDPFSPINCLNFEMFTLTQLPKSGQFIVKLPADHLSFNGISNYNIMYGAIDWITIVTCNLLCVVYLL